MLYPLSVAIAAAWILVGGSHPLDRMMCWGLILPALVEHVGEQGGWLAHRPARQVFFTVLASVAVGRGVSRYLQRPGDRIFWIMVVEVVVAAALGAWLGIRRNSGVACDEGSPR